jgi:hypothetical protein
MKKRKHQSKKTFFLKMRTLDFTLIGLGNKMRTFNFCSHFTTFSLKSEYWTQHDFFFMKTNQCEIAETDQCKRALEQNENIQL